ncbi:hypothetical protein [Actinophytocola sp.]|uniref:hypothetical protein n=1 Tax=Actinophytocola sp. TaxID=1872138 RepID=UPI002ED5F700
MTVIPLVDRVGHVAGVESIVVDGRRWYFGMDYGSDLVVSPLVEDSGDMAEFAAQYMAQSDGMHDVAYWADQVAWADENSDLVEPGGNVYDSATLAAGIDYGLLYLFGAVTGWEGDVFADDNWDEISESLDDAEVQRRLRESLASRLPADWATVFAPFFQSGNEIPPKV